MKRKEFIAMKISTLRRIIRDGLENLYKNKIMTLASVAIVATTVLVFGMFLTTFLNVREINNDLKKIPIIEIFCDENLDDVSIDEIEKQIAKIDGIKGYRKVGKEEAFKKTQEFLGENKNILDGMSEDFLPVSFRVNVFDSEGSEKIVEAAKKISGVEDVSWSKKEVDFVNKAVHTVNFIGGVFVLVFFVISLGIIVNTIKLTVNARRREISIMKYVGASDIFVRGPFVVEGIVIGIVGAIIAFFVVGHGYIMLTASIKNSLPEFRVVLLKDIINSSLALCVLLGGTLGAVGGVCSVQKYLKKYS